MSWRSKAWVKRALEPIYTDEVGRPLAGRPDPDDFETYAEFLEGLRKYREQVADFSNRVFAEQFRKSMCEPWDGVFRFSSEETARYDARIAAIKAKANA